MVGSVLRPSHSPGQPAPAPPDGRRHAASAAPEDRDGGEDRGGTQVTPLL